ncbi:MAG: hypothetical protein ACRD2J_14115, partial [Thermoanaerobaculia bacterium]
WKSLGIFGWTLESTTVQPLASASVAKSALAATAGPIVRTIQYQPDALAFVASIDANGLAIDAPESHRKTPLLDTFNDGIVRTEVRDTSGLVEEITTTGGTDPSGAGSEVTIDYAPPAAPEHERALPTEIDSGGLESTFSYPDATTIVATDPQGIVTTTKLDAWDRVIERVVSGPGLETLERFSYDATGRLRVVQRKQGAGVVSTEHEYDAVGRIKATSVDNVAVDGQLSKIETLWTHDYPSRTILRKSPTGALTQITLDGLGRTIESSTSTGQTAIESLAAHDILGNQVYSSDGFVASAAAFDVHGRQVLTLNADGTRTEAEFDAWNRTTAVTTLTSTGEVLAAEAIDYTAAGRIEEITTAVDDDTARTTDFAWDGGGRTTRSATGDRIARSRFDTAGRFVESSFGTAAETFTETQASLYKGYWPRKMTTIERDAPAPLEETRAFDALGNVVQRNVGSLEWTSQFDEAGNVVSASLPERPPSAFAHDARGAVLEETQPDGAKLKYGYGAAGAMKTYEDQVAEVTHTETDLIGRPILRMYPDGTLEQWVWKGVRLESYRDRQERTRVYQWNARGQLEKVMRPGGEVLDHLEYDAAGRMVRWTNADTALTWQEFDLEGRPRRTRQIRYRDGTGHTTKQILDEFVQEHGFNELGERTFTTMPAYPGMPSVPGATESLEFGYDAFGNLVHIRRDGNNLLTGTFRNAGRPDERIIHTNCEPGAPLCTPADIVKSYAYDAETGQLTRAAVSVGGLVVAGSEVTYDGLQVSSARLLGVSSNERRSFFRYDDRGRLAGSIYATLDDAPDSLEAIPGRAKEELTPADFRMAQGRLPIFDEPTRNILIAAGIDPDAIEPPTITA